MARKHRFFNMYFTTTISVALVLFLVGLECVTMLSTHQLVRSLKENVALTVILSDKATSDQIEQLGEQLKAAPYCRELHYISKEQALQDHIEALGEDPVKFLGYNPLSNSYEVNMVAEYAVEDSIMGIAEQLMALPTVSVVDHPQEVVSFLDLHIGKLSLMLIVVALVLLLISMVLIINTVRLHVYSKRFIINTMRLVGATSWVIRAPFIRRNLLLGLEAGLLAILGVAGAVVAIHERLGIWLFNLTWYNCLIIVVFVILGGQLITFFAALIATGRYIRMKTDKMYEI